MKIQAIDEMLIWSEQMEIMKCAADLGHEIRARRKELGYTQAFVAEYAGVSASFLSELENGKETIRIDKALHVAGLLGLNVLVERRGG